MTSGQPTNSPKISVAVAISTPCLGKIATATKDNAGLNSPANSPTQKIIGINTSTNEKAGYTGYNNPLGSVDRHRLSIASLLRSRALCKGLRL